ncbi:hypothetical protein [Sphingomonas sp. NFR15]|uniref:hypothetical protein n=1 Tax=Sphingomonas sp. NFR15 TaxID=1566282 RepID=UPI000882C320|nr:hypothetical protein [Sphingomonas sp. NFR15]SDA27439.1 hypothetical protein SAMN03159340_02170 [Sphingomonas sp. NFR15]
METLRYPYRPKTWVMALAGLFFAVCAVVLGYTAHDNDRGLLIDGILSLDAGQASIIYWVLCALSIGFVAAGLFGVVTSLREPREVMVDRTGVTLPAGRWSSDTVTIPFASITDLRIQQVHSHKFLIIRHRAGKHSVMRSMMPSSADFEAFVEAVMAGRARSR